MPSWRGFFLMIFNTKKSMGNSKIFTVSERVGHQVFLSNFPTVLSAQPRSPDLLFLLPCRVPFRVDERCDSNIKSQLSLSMSDHMTKQEFADIIFRLEELLIETDLWRLKIGECGGQCNGSNETDYRKMCPSCSSALQKELEAIKKLTANDEFNGLMSKVKEALEGDRTGEFKQMLDFARRATVH